MRYSALLLLLVLLAGCASTARVIPKDNGDYLVIGTSNSESGAYDAALDKGQDTCKDTGKHFFMVKQDSHYQGMDKNAKAVVNTIGAMGGYWGMGDRRDDNKVEIVFRCK